MIIGYNEFTNTNKKIGEVKNSYFSQRISEYAREEEKYRTYVTYVVLKKLADEIGFDIDQIEIVRDQNGKPCTKNGEFYFNISHSGNMVVVGIDNNPIGVDIEYIRPYDKRIAKKFFEDKIEEIEHSVNPNFDFTKQWTIFEAKLKYYGSLTLLKQSSSPNTLTKTLQGSTQNYIISVATTTHTNDSVMVVSI